ncbi:hypothetical protein TrLO_g2575 [Triparma laevis f. longispina]|uniref:Large ribosomal subunit protein mL43 n=1 Tax=Triparma laevis f. longispina TaxID=1714387 RepID=A0A9W6ZUQ2_9STRA|nr:hypothetical protein TrLO_g2575 [Triparma laevis f. longispina]
MATHGQRQLLRLTLSYCPNGGSSSSFRSLLQSSPLIDFARAHPDLEIKTTVKPNHHPSLLGEYRTGWDKQIGCRGLNENDVLKKIAMLNNSSGRKITKIRGGHRTASCQGVWTPGLDLLNAKEFEIKEVVGS